MAGGKFDSLHSLTRLFKVIVPTTAANQKEVGMISGRKIATLK